MKHNYVFKQIFTCLIAVLPLTTFAQKQSAPEGNWYIEMDYSDFGFMRFTMTFEKGDGTFEAYTRKKADKDILGGWTSMMARTMTSNFKDGSLMRIEKGIYATDNDTLKIAGILTSALGSFNIQGYVMNGEMHATLSNKSQGFKGTFTGYKKEVKLPLQDYSAVFEQAMATTESKVYNKALLQAKEWKAFEKDMKVVSSKMQNDMEMLFAFYYYAGKLPISHYMLMPNPQHEDTADITTEETAAKAEKKQRFALLEEKTPQTAYMRIASFGGTAEEIDSLFTIIRQRGYSNLIVDLRNNPGGSVPAGMAFATNVADTTFYGGVFLTQRYFEDHQSPPNVEEYTGFPHFTAANYDLLMEGIHNTKGVCLKIIPQQQTYNGKMYILTNGNTASTCEPIVYAFKHRKRAIVVGETTAGAMLTGEEFDLENGFKLFLPTADYYAADGYRIDQKGVTPDIEVKQEETLEYVLNMIGQPKG